MIRQMPSADITSAPTEAADRALARSREVLTQIDATSPAASAAVARARAITAIVASLTDDVEIVVGSTLAPLLIADVINDERALALGGADAARIASELRRLGSLPVTSIRTTSGAASTALSAQQAEALRKMLLAIVTDPRLVLIRLAAQLHDLREAKDQSPAERERLALETRQIYAPLGNRLGVWQLKWELEDLSFRYLEPENYREVAGWLAAKRIDREQYIDDVTRFIAAELRKVGIDADVAGRPKHLYSIWRKMQRKGLTFDQLYDIRAVRVLVATVADCYAALGVVHSLWPYIPGEFDDYIATPKDNLYRSLHTAVIGPGKEPLEIQIRTRDMHEHAELGVAAHWRYKEGGKGDAAYEQKIVWLRQILEPAERDEESAGDFLERVRSEVFEDRVYALSPRGEVIDLPRGATPLDFAYHLHTDLGHRCRGAKVNGRMVSLNQTLANGDQVEIITGKHPNPSRDWLVPSLGYLVSQRNRNKVRSWFRKLDEEQNRQQGRQILERELQRLAIHTVTLPELISEFRFENAGELYLAIGEGEINAAQITGAIQRRAKPQELPSPIARKPAARPKDTAGVTVEGVGDLLSSFARCCGPVPPEPISGYITLGRGVSIHREECPNLRRLQTANPERVIAVEWGSGSDQSFPVEVNVRAFDRRGLVRDISAVLADSRINIHAMDTRTDGSDGIADMNLKITVHDLSELSRVLARIQGLANVLSVRRRA
jgi:GTP pyrophosphokinase